MTPKLPIYEFIRTQGRLPTVKDDPKPWTYRGWLLPYVISLHEHPWFGKDIDTSEVPRDMVRTGCCPDRWGYYLRTLAAGKLLDEPIPRIDFRSEHSNPVKSWVDGEAKGMGALLRIVENRVSTTAFRAIVDWIAFGLAIDSAFDINLEDDYHDRLYRTFNVEPLLLEPSDYFGQFLAASKTNKFNTTGFYPTPHVLVDVITRMTIESFKPEAGDERDPRVYSICDPCVGTGRFLLEASNYSFNLWGMDIDPLVIKIAKINGALYAPWLTWPFSAEVLGVKAQGGLHVGDSLLRPFTEPSDDAPSKPEPPAKKLKRKPAQSSLF